MYKEFIEKFRIEELKVFESQYWVLSLRPLQITIGSLILSLKRECSNMAMISALEAEELPIIFAKIDEVYEHTFKPDKINYLVLMMVDKQVHFHIVPRYEKEVEFLGELYGDKDWPKPPDVLFNLDIQEHTLSEIVNFMRAIPFSK